MRVSLFEVSKANCIRSTDQACACCALYVYMHVNGCTWSLNEPLMLLSYATKKTTNQAAKNGKRKRKKPSAH